MQQFTKWKAKLKPKPKVCNPFPLAITPTNQPSSVLQNNLNSHSTLAISIRRLKSPPISRRWNPARPKQQCSHHPYKDQRIRLNRPRRLQYLQARNVKYRSGNCVRETPPRQIITHALSLDRYELLLPCRISENPRPLPASKQASSKHAATPPLYLLSLRLEYDSLTSTVTKKKRARLKSC